MKLFCLQPTNEHWFDLERLNTLASNEILDRQQGASASDVADNKPKIFKGDK